jgi:hypothetical protein
MEPIPTNVGGHLFTVLYFDDKGLFTLTMSQAIAALILTLVGRIGAGGRN